MPIFNFSGLFSSLLRLLATHFPHLSLVEDWLDDDDFSLTYVSAKIISEDTLADGKLFAGVSYPLKVGVGHNLHFKVLICWQFY